MPDKKKLSLGPLPPEKEDYSNYEQVDILWGRISMLAMAVALTLGGAGYIYFQSSGAQPELASKPAFDAPKETELLAQASNESSVPLLSKSSSEGAGASSKTSPTPVVASLELKKTSDADIDETQQSEPVMNALASQSQEATPGNLELGIQQANNTSIPAPVSAITTLHTGIQSAVLSSAVDQNRKPVDALGYDIKMNEDGLIKVVLYTDLAGLNGRTLYHDWVLGDERQARVRIPVRSDQQSSYSSKFIDRNMLGDWTVKVRDDDGEMYALAQFRVQAK